MTTIIIATERHRQNAVQTLATLPLGYRVEFKEPKRSSIQNDRMWSMLADLAEQDRWHGLKMSDEHWKDLLSAGLHKETRVVPNLDGTGFVTLGRRTSKMSIREMTELMDLIEAFGAQRGVTFRVHAVRFDEHGQEVGHD